MINHPLPASVAWIYPPSLNTESPCDIVLPVVLVSGRRFVQAGFAGLAIFHFHVRLLQVVSAAAATAAASPETGQSTTSA